MADYVQVTTTTDSRETAADLGRSAVEAQLAASAQVVGPVATIYRHNGDVLDGEEWSVLLKTTEAQYGALEKHLVDHHPYDSPEVTATPIVRGVTSYLDWISRVTQN